MQRLKKIVIGMAALLMIACGESGGPGDNGSGMTELRLRQQLSGTISSVGEVDWYFFRAAEANTIMQVRCSSDTIRPDVDLLVTVFEQDGQGNRTRLYADHAPDNGVSPADLKLNIYIDQPKDIVISVRDLMDDDASDHPYYLVVDFSPAAPGDGSFAQARPLTAGSDTCLSDSIEAIGDVDCYAFPSLGGVFELDVTFSPLDGSRVQLALDLFDDQGGRLDRLTGGSLHHFKRTHFLPAGTYYVEIDDEGRDDFDPGSPYTICINPVPGVEADQNDRMADAEAVSLSAFDTDQVIPGSLDYVSDADWYQITLPSPGSGFRILDLRFAGTAAREYQVQLLDGNGQTILSHAFNGGSPEYHTLVKLDRSDCYLVVTPGNGQTEFTAMPYTATVRARAIQDAAEVPPNANDTIGTADALTFSADAADATSGKISYRGDVDWYAVTIPAHAVPQVLEVFLEAPLSLVEYALSVMNTDLLEKQVNYNAETTTTVLKSGLLVPANDQDAVYTIKVSDFQDDDGDDVTYTIRANLQSIPGALPAAPAGSPPDGEPVQYHDEAQETAGDTVALYLNPDATKTFVLDTNRLDSAGAVQQADTPSAGLTTVTFPWVAGYMDYKGDQDWFRIDIQPLDAAAEWYYDIQVQLYAPASAVEYVWKFFPDVPNDGTLADRRSSYSGFMASAGDTGTAEAALDITTPSGDDAAFWIGADWSGYAYFSISDFNYVTLPSGSGANPLPDADWGEYGLAPYYFQVTLVYHPGASHPQ